MGVGGGNTVPLALTFVEYESGDTLGLCLALSSLLPFFIGFALLTLIVVRRDIHTVSSQTVGIVNQAR